jgi:hypothetical protein
MVSPIFPESCKPEFLRSFMARTSVTANGATITVVETESRNSQSFSVSALQRINAPFTSALKRTAMIGDRIPETRTR